ncbi:MAG: glycosyltransferase [Patescibacteria group bacterium]
MDENRERITLLVPAYNEEKSIGKCIKSIDGQILSEKLKVLVIPNGCSDRTTEIVKREISLAKNKLISWEVIELSEGNKVRAINEGVRKAETEFVATMDSDSWIRPELISMTIKKMSEEPKLMILGAIYEPDFSKSIKGSLLEQFQKILYYNLLVSTFRIPIGRFMAFRKNSIPEIPQTIAEDTWLALETIKKYGNESVRVDNDLVVHYQPTLNWVDFIRQETRFVRATEVMFDRYPELKKIYEETNMKLKKPFEARMNEISELMKKDEIPQERLLQARNLLIPLLKENAAMVKDQPIMSDGRWEVIDSTK